MMRAAFRKALADFRVRRLQTFLLFVVIAAASATLSLALTVQSSASQPYERTISDANMAHLWVTITSSNADADVQALSGMPGVQATSGPYPILFAGFSLSTTEKKQELDLIGMDAQLPDVDHPVVTDGRWLAARGADDIVLDRGAARRMGVDAGDRIELLTAQGLVPFEVVGLAVPVGRAPAPIDEEGFAYVLRDTLWTLSPGAQLGDDYAERLGVQLTSDAAMPEFLAAADNVLSSDGVHIDKMRDDIAQDIEDSNMFDVIFLSVFSIFALLAAGLIIANAIAGQVLSQRRDIGLLKSVGFTPGQVTFVYLAESVGLGVVAAAFGIVCGLLAAPYFLSRTAELLGVTSSPVIDPLLIAITIGVVAAIVAIFTGISAWQAGRVGTIQALTASAKAGARRSRLGALAAWLHLPVVVVIGVKDLSSHTGRTIATTIALVLAVITATFTLGIESTFNKTMRDPASMGAPPFDLITDRDIYPPDEATKMLDARPEIERYIVRTDIDATYDGQDFELRGLDGDLAKARWRFIAGRMVESRGEVVVGHGFARDMGIEIGDRISVDLLHGGQGEDLAGQKLDLTVVGRYLEFDDEVMMVTSETLPSAAAPTDYLIKTVPGTDNHAFGRELLQASGGNFDPEVIDESIAEVRTVFRSVVLALNAVLFAIAAINLLSTLMLGIRESQRDFAVFKALGLMPAQIGISVFVGSTVLAVAATIVGIPLGLVATMFLFDMMSQATNLGTNIGALPSIGWLLLIVPGAIVLAGLGTVLPARAAAAIRPTDALRYE